jgi:hypothetical protein
VNQDFLISGSPGMARRLVQLASVCTINLDPAVVALAGTGFLTDEDFAPYPKLSLTERSAVQRIIDFEFRCVFPAQGTVGGMVLLAAAKLAKIEPIFVLTRRERYWQSFAEEMKIPPENLVMMTRIDRRKGPDPDLIRDRRHGLLIVDEMMDSLESSILAMDFQKTVILSNRRLITDLTQAITVLSPDSPTDLLTNINPYFKKDLAAAGFKTTRREDLAFMLGVVTDLMVFTSEPDPEDIEIDPELFARLERNVALGHLRLDG